MHLTTSPIDWYAARAAGIVAYLLLTAVVAMGIGLASKLQTARWPRFAVEDVHRFGGLLVGSFIAIHVATIAIDAYLPFSLTQLAVPLTATYRPLWTALGIVAAELLVALAVANHYRRRMPYRVWRTSHYLNFAVWVAATLHGLGSGTDRSAPWMIGLYAGAVSLVAVAVLWRTGQARLLPVGGAVALVPVVLALGPLARHAHHWNATSFHDTLSGQILQQQGAAGAIVSMAGSGRGDQPVLVRADLLLEVGRAERTSFQMEFLPSGQFCRGRVDRVRSFGFDGTCTMPDGSRRAVTANWRLVNGARLQGSIVGHA
ncbi:MAG: ferric reductase-like transmembrane domain-containing protein [Gaiellales bacterium]